jgi:signal peptidase II
MLSLLSGAGAFLTDQFLKSQVEKDKIKSGKQYFGDLITIKKSVNKGLIMNNLEERPRWVLSWVSAMFGMTTYIYLLTLGKKHRKVKRLGLALMVGAAASNLYDRIKKGGVTDYFVIKGIPKIIFNLSDIVIILGAVISVVGEIVGNDE